MIQSLVAGADDNVNGGLGYDYFNFNSGSAINLTLSTGTSTATGNGADSLTSIEDFDLSNQSDTVSVNVGDINTFNGQSMEVHTAGGINDHVDVNASGGTLTSNGLDGDDFADLFTNVEELDFRNTDLTGGDTFRIGDDDIGGIDTNNGFLTIFVDTSTILLSEIEVLSQSSAITSDNTVGSTRTVDWGRRYVINCSGLNSIYFSD